MFGEQDLALERRLGVIFLVLLATIISAVLLLPEHRFRRHIPIKVEFSTPGTLRPRAPIRVAGRNVGEVRRLHFEKLAGGGRRVVADCAVAASWARRLPRNSEFFVSTPTIVGESFLEVGPPRHQAAPGPHLRPGDRVQGVDAADLGSLGAYMQKASRAIGADLRDLAPNFNELRATSAALARTYDETLADKEVLAHIRGHAAHAHDELVALDEAIHTRRTLARLATIGRSWESTMTEVVPDGRGLKIELARIGDGARRLSSIWNLESRRAMRSLRLVMRGCKRINAAGIQLQQLIREVKRGEGTLGALLTDPQLRGEARELRLIIKKQPWKVLFKKKAKGD